MRHITKAGFAALAGAFVIMTPAAGEARVMNLADGASFAPSVRADRMNWRGHGYQRWGYAPRWNHATRWGHARWGYAPRWGHTHWGYAPRWGHTRWAYTPRYSTWGYAPAATWGYSAAAAPYCDYGAWGYSPVGGALGVAAGVATAPLWAAGAVTSPLWGSAWW